MCSDAWTWTWEVLEERVSLRNRECIWWWNLRRTITEGKSDVSAEAIWQNEQHYLETRQRNDVSFAKESFAFARRTWAANQNTYLWPEWNGPGSSISPNIPPLKRRNKGINDANEEQQPGLGSCQQSLHGETWWFFQMMWMSVWKRNSSTCRSTILFCSMTLCDRIISKRVCLC